LSTQLKAVFTGTVHRFSMQSPIDTPMLDANHPAFPAFLATKPDYGNMVPLWVAFKTKWDAVVVPAAAAASTAVPAAPAAAAPVPAASVPVAAVPAARPRRAATAPAPVDVSSETEDTASSASGDSAETLRVGKLWRKAVQDLYDQCEADNEPRIRESWTSGGLWWPQIKSARFAYAKQFGTMTVEELRNEPLYDWMGAPKDPNNMFVCPHVDRSGYECVDSVEHSRFILDYTDCLRKYQKEGVEARVPLDATVYSEFCVFKLGSFNRNFAVTGTVRNTSALDQLRFYVPGRSTKTALLEQLRADSGRRTAADRSVVITRAPIILAEWGSGTLQGAARAAAAGAAGAEGLQVLADAAAGARAGGSRQASPSASARSPSAAKRGRVTAAPSRSAALMPPPPARTAPSTPVASPINRARANMLVGTVFRTVMLYEQHVQGLMKVLEQGGFQDADSDGCLYEDLSRTFNHLDYMYAQYDDVLVGYTRLSVSEIRAVMDRIAQAP
jgi:hypothetical protein